MRDEPQIRIRRRIIIYNNHKRCQFIETAGRWSWKLKTDRECVPTHLPNELILKMDCVRIISRSRICFEKSKQCREVLIDMRNFHASGCEDHSSTDLGGSSN